MAEIQHSPYFDFLKNMWIMKELTEVNLTNAVTKKLITEDEKIEILAILQVE